MNKFLSGVALFAASIGSGVYTAYVLTFLWLWFVVPLGVVPIGLFWAWGLFGLVRWLTTPYSVLEVVSKSEHRSKGWDDALSSYVIVSIVWATGAILHAFM